MADEGRFVRAIAAIDAANAADPTLVQVGGECRPKELWHSELVTRWVLRLRPDPSQALLLAARAHHLRRWMVPRSSYPAGRTGYLRWRRDLHQYHAQEVAKLLVAEGYDRDTVERVGDIVQKRHLASDPEVQALEDALCLVFLETQFSELATRTDPERMVDIVRRTLAKMSETGRRHAMEMANMMVDADRDVLERALG